MHASASWLRTYASRQLPEYPSGFTFPYPGIFWGHYVAPFFVPQLIRASAWTLLDSAGESQNTSRPARLRGKNDNQRGSKMADDRGKVTDKAGEIAKNIWLAGVGAYGRAVDEAQGRMEKAGVEPPKLFRELVKAGAALEEEARGALEAGHTARSSVEERIQRVRDNFNMQRPVRGEDLLALHEKIDRLSNRLDALTEALASSGAVKTPKKKATPRKKTPAKRKATARSAKASGKASGKEGAKATAAKTPKRTAAKKTAARRPQGRRAR